MKKIYYSQSEALEAALELKKENPNYTVLSGKTLDLDYDIEQSDSFSELVKNWAGEVAAYEVLDEKGQTVAKIGYWDTESVELARARRDVYGAVATWNADPFSVEGESIEEVAQFITRDDVSEQTVNEGDINEDEWAGLLGQLDLEVGDTSVVHVFRELNGNEQLVLCYSQDF